MLQVLQERNVHTDFDFDNILVEVYPQPVTSDGTEGDAPHVDHAQEIFTEVNKAEPVKLVDMPGVAKSSHRNIINEGATRLQERFPNMFSDSQRCRPRKSLPRSRYYCLFNLLRKISNRTMYVRLVVNLFLPFPNLPFCP